MSEYYRDFVEPVKLIFTRLIEKITTKGVTGGGSPPSPNVKTPIDLPEYPCNLIRENGKVVEIQYGLSSTGYIWKQNVIRDSEGKVTGIKETLPDGGGTITLYRDNDKVTEIDYL